RRGLLFADGEQASSLPRPNRAPCCGTPQRAGSPCPGGSWPDALLRPAFTKTLETLRNAFSGPDDVGVLFFARQMLEAQGPDLLHAIVDSLLPQRQEAALVFGSRKLGTRNGGQFLIYQHVQRVSADRPRFGDRLLAFFSSRARRA